MIAEVTLGSTRNAELRDRMVGILKREERLTGHLVTGWPLYRTGCRVRSIDATLISDTGQVTLLDVVENQDPGSYRERQDDAHNQARCELQMERGLMDGRRPRFTIQTVTYAPLSGREDRSDPERPIVSSPAALLEIILDAQRSMAGTADPGLVFCRMGPG